MRILIFSPWFHPHLGGVETVCELLAGALSRQHSVCVVTRYPSGDPEPGWPFRVLRRPPLLQLWKEIRGSDAVLSFGPSLRFVPLVRLAGRLLLVNHYTWPPWRSRPLVCALQALCCLGLRNLAPSLMLAEALWPRGRWMPNPYDDRIFHSAAEESRNGELVFLGRLVPEKGLDILLHSLAVLARQGIRPRLTVVGSGSAGEALQRQAQALGLQQQVVWQGPLKGVPLASLLRRHQVLVVPSRWREPFGIVALEGLACGCRLVVADHAGLREAAGPTALSFEPGDAEHLALQLQQALSGAERPPGHVDAHLSRHRPLAVAAFFETLLVQSVRR